jgi:hypothetical protein
MNPMAKIHARGASEVARLKAGRRNDDGVVDSVATYVLRSDGAVLRKASYDSGYKLWRRLAKTMPWTEAQLRKVLTEGFGLEVTQ